MPEIAFTPNLDAVSGADVYEWDDVTSSDSFAYVKPRGTRSLAGAVQFTGTLDGATVVMQASNDGTNWWTVQDVEGADLSTAAAGGAAEFSTSALYLRPSASGGGGSQAIDVTICLRG